MDSMEFLNATSNRSFGHQLQIRSLLASAETSLNVSHDLFTELELSVRTITTDTTRAEMLSQVLAEVSWMVEARTRIEQRAKDIYGESTLVWFKSRFDSRRDPTDYQVVYAYAPQEITAERLIDGEDRLVDYLVDSLHDVEQHFVVVCHRRNPSKFR